MAARAIWKGRLAIASVRLPVKLYSAVSDRTVRFHILDDRSLMRVKQHMVNPDTGEEVPSGEISKGYEIERGKYVILTGEDLESLTPASSRDIEINEFIPNQQLGQQWYDRPYYLGPDGDEKAYFALAEALNRSGREGIAHWVMRKRSYVGALRAQDGYLWLVTLHNAEEVITARDLPQPTTRQSSPAELKLAKQLVEAVQGEFNPSEYKDEYRKRVLDFIDEKAEGHKPRLRALKSKHAPASLEDALTRSLAALKKEKRSA